MDQTFGFIGTGNMGGALASAAVRSVPKTAVFLANRTVAKAQALAEKLGCGVADNDWIAANCSYIFLGVKPQMMASVLQQLQPVLAARKDAFALVSMAAGLQIARIQEMAGDNYPVIRIMPNTPVAVGSGVVLYDTSDNVTEEQKRVFCTGMAAAGLLDPLPERLMDAGSAVAGCGPAYAAMFLEALADGGVACGLPRDKALEYAAQMLLGTAKLAMESGMHPGQLKDGVCSPGGATIAGVAALEQGGFRGSAMQAVQAAYRKTLELGK